MGEFWGFLRTQGGDNKEGTRGENLGKIPEFLITSNPLFSLFPASPFSRPSYGSKSCEFIFPAAFSWDFFWGWKKTKILIFSMYFFHENSDFSRTSVYDSRARERWRQIEEQKALAMQLQSQVRITWEKKTTLD